MSLIRASGPTRISIYRNDTRRVHEKDLQDLYEEDVCQDHQVIRLAKKGINEHLARVQTLRAHQDGGDTRGEQSIMPTGSAS